MVWVIIPIHARQKILLKHQMNRNGVCICLGLLFRLLFRIFSLWYEEYGVPDEYRKYGSHHSIDKSCFLYPGTSGTILFIPFVSLSHFFFTNSHSSNILYTFYLVTIGREWFVCCINANPR